MHDFSCRRNAVCVHGRNHLWRADYTMNIWNGIINIIIRLRLIKVLVRIYQHLQLFFANLITLDNIILSLKNERTYMHNSNGIRFQLPDQDIWKSKAFIFLWIFTFRRYIYWSYWQNNSWQNLSSRKENISLYKH